MPTYASDGDCDGGGPGAEYLGCQLGTDCAGADCGPRFRLPQPHAPPIRAETCNWASDGPIATTAAPARSSARGPGTNSKVCVCTYSKHTFTNQPTAMRHGHAWGPHSKVSRGKNPFFSRLDLGRGPRYSRRRSLQSGGAHTQVYFPTALEDVPTSLFSTSNLDVLVVGS